MAKKKKETKKRKKVQKKEVTRNQERLADKNDLDLTQPDQESDWSFDSFDLSPGPEAESPVEEMPVSSPDPLEILSDSEAESMDEGVSVSLQAAAEADGQSQSQEKQGPDFEDLLVGDKSQEHCADADDPDLTQPDSEISSSPDPLEILSDSEAESTDEGVSVSLQAAAEADGQSQSQEKQGPDFEDLLVGDKSQEHCADADDPDLTQPDSLELSSDSETGSPAEDVPVPPPAVETADQSQSHEKKGPDSEGPLDELIAKIDEETGHEFGLEFSIDEDAKLSDEDGEKQRYIIFALADTEYAVPAANVQEVGEILRITPLPNVPSWLAGVANKRGDIISMVDLRVFLGFESIDYEHGGRMLVAQADQGKMVIGLMVDQVSAIRLLPTGRIDALTSPIEGKVTPYLQGVCEHDGRLLAVLDVEQMLLSAEMQQFQAI